MHYSSCGDWARKAAPQALMLILEVGDTNGTTQLHTKYQQLQIQGGGGGGGFKGYNNAPSSIQNVDFHAKINAFCVAWNQWGRSTYVERIPLSQTQNKPPHYYITIHWALFVLWGQMWVLWREAKWKVNPYMLWSGTPPSSSYHFLGPVLIALWSKAPPLTTCCLSPLHGFESWPGHVRKMPMTWG